MVNILALQLFLNLIFTLVLPVHMKASVTGFVATGVQPLVCPVHAGIESCDHTEA